MSACQELIASIAAHPASWTLGGAYVASALITALPEPGTKEQTQLMLYRYFYTVAHTLVNAIPSKYRPAVTDPNVQAK